MARRELIFTEGEYGFDHTFYVKDEDGNAVNIASYTGARLVIVDPDDITDIKLDITSNLTINTNSVVWAIQNGQTDYNGNLVATIHLTANGLLEKVYQFSVVVNPKLI